VVGPLVVICHPLSSSDQMIDRFAASPAGDRSSRRITQKWQTKTTGLFAASYETDGSF
jgi:hypothetical protein